MNQGLTGELSMRFEVQKIEKVVVIRRVQIPLGIWKKVISVYLKIVKITMKGQ